MRLKTRKSNKQGLTPISLKQKIDKEYVDKDGDVVSKKSGPAHMKPDEFNFRVKPNGK